MASLSLGSLRTNKFKLECAQEQSAGTEQIERLPEVFFHWSLGSAIFSLLSWKQGEKRKPPLPPPSKAAGWFGTAGAAGQALAKSSEPSAALLHLALLSFSLGLHPYCGRDGKEVLAICLGKEFRPLMVQRVCTIRKGRGEGLFVRIHHSDEMLQGQEVGGHLTQAKFSKWNKPLIGSLDSTLNAILHLIPFTDTAVVSKLRGFHSSQVPKHYHHEAMTQHSACLQQPRAERQSGKRGRSFRFPASHFVTF